MGVRQGTGSESELPVMKASSDTELTKTHLDTLERHDCDNEEGGVYALTSKERILCETLEAWGLLEFVRRDERGPIYRTTDAGRAAYGLPPNTSRRCWQCGSQTTNKNDVNPLDNSMALCAVCYRGREPSHRAGEDS